MEVRKAAAMPTAMVAVYLVMFASVFSFVSGHTTEEQQQQQQQQQQLQAAQLKLAQLESRHSEIRHTVKAKDLLLEEKKKQIEELENQTNGLVTVKDVGLLEEEVRLLWAMSRKNNFDLHVLKSKAREAEERLEVLTSQVEKMADIVAERWIRIQQFEQALLDAQMRVSKAKMDMRPPQYRFLKLMDGISGKYLPKALRLWSFHLSGKLSVLGLDIPKIPAQLNGSYTAAKEFHHELQVLVRQEMERHELTAHFANEELVFFLVSALFIFPMLSAWVVLSSYCTR